MKIRPRRLRNSTTLRSLVRETRISKSQLIYPLFIEEGVGIKTEISSMKGQYRFSLDKIYDEISSLLELGISSVILFGIPLEKDPYGKGAYDDDGIIQKAIRYIKKNFPAMQIVTDVCMCEYTSTGHCGILDGDYVDNDKTLKYLNKIAVSHAKAGADIVAPSDMMDGRIGSIRDALDKNNFECVSIMAYSAKYASSFYGPFRDAANSAPSFGDRKTYQMDYHNAREGLKEVSLDINEGADIVMVKPALSYLDIISNVKQSTLIPVCAYSVSGEYAMIRGSADLGYIDLDALICETTISIFRAGADILITYFAKEIAKFIDEGRIG